MVTNARGGFSNHNFGIAIDITIFKGSTDPEQAKTSVFESPLYKVIGALGTEIGLEWGGNWISLKDEPHFQLRPGVGRRNEGEGHVGRAPHAQGIRQRFLRLRAASVTVELLD